jgi:hypothetical protein
MTTTPDRPLPPPFDLAVSLGPNCRSTWNLRQHLGVAQSYPFDWWITPSRSMLRMIEPGFRFELERTDLHVIAQADGGETVYNARHHLLHHHDFPRDAQRRQLPLTEEAIDKVRDQYTRRFERFQRQMGQAKRPLCVLNGTYAGWPGLADLPMPADLNRAIDEAELAEAIRARLGAHVTVLFILEGNERLLRADWGASLRWPDDGTRSAPRGSGYAEPVNIFTRAYAWLQAELGPYTPNPALSSSMSQTPAPLPTAAEILRQLYQPPAPTVPRFATKTRFAPTDFPPVGEDSRPTRTRPSHNHQT